MVKVKKDLTGMRINSLVVIKQVEDYVSPSGKRSARWLCQCDCGNQKEIVQDTLKAGRIKTCGCGQLAALQRHNLEQKKNNDATIVGQSFGQLTVIERDNSYSNTKVYYKCLCECGNTISIPRSKLLSGEIDNCGCKDQRHRRYLDISGQRFGKLVALYPTEARNKNMYWMCQCDCGKQIELCGDSIRRGNTMSCGCMKQSHGEYIIEQLLLENNISYIKEYAAFKYDNEYSARFDFYVNNSYLIEFDGQQHFETNNRWWNTQEFVEQQKIKDEIKNQWCKQNNIPLIRIPYYALSKLTYADIDINQSQYIV